MQITLKARLPEKVWEADVLPLNYAREFPTKSVIHEVKPVDLFDFLPALYLRPLSEVNASKVRQRDLSGCTQMRNRRAQAERDCIMADLVTELDPEAAPIA